MSRIDSDAGGDSAVISIEPWPSKRPDSRVHRFILEIKDEAASDVLLASLPLLERLLTEKTAEVRERRLEEMVDFMAGQMVLPSRVDLEMAQRMAKRYARLLNEFGYFTAEQLAQANRSQASNRSALADNWRKRRQVFSVPHPDKVGARAMSTRRSSSRITSRSKSCGK